ncbi:hypothetical protein CERZMDRAFT_102107 [Cercospora zeae-maydis SCOH1-5]|uniref:Uncharacterized protein n=1 Tax=Cercospora zeae-maydis SCOH1-5 TaxID=717836 RepID=A0A6A6F3N2_9PEZI|nr:hypothetical protein CERZMDRAFT_102107 [Cercospora zeae-maydis SCOH1-5]
MASTQADRPTEKLFHGVPIYGLRSGFRATVRADQETMNMIATALVVNELGLNPIDPSATSIQEAVDEAKCAAGEYLVDQNMFPTAALRDVLRQAPKTNRRDEYPGFRSQYFDMGEWLSDLRDYSACYEGKYVYDVAVLTQAQDPSEPVVFNVFKSQPTKQTTHTLWYVRKMCRAPGGGGYVEMLQALVPQPAPTPEVTAPVLPAPIAVPVAQPSRVQQPKYPHHRSAAPYAGWTADQIFAQVHTEHMFGGVILVLHLEYTKAELFKKINQKRQQVEGLQAFGTSSKQVVHYRIKAALQHLFGKDNYDTNANSFKEAAHNIAQATAWRAALDAPATYNVATCDMGCSRRVVAAPVGEEDRQTDEAGPSSSRVQGTAISSGAAEAADPLFSGHSQAQMMPAEAQMSAGVVRHESPDRSTFATASDTVPRSSAPVLDPALLDGSWINATSSAEGEHPRGYLH